MAFVDGFAGRGEYTSLNGETFAGSPLLALRMLAGDSALAKQVNIVLIEPRPDHFTHLETVVKQFCSSNPGLASPTLVNGQFAKTLRDDIASIRAQGVFEVPTFLFVDPCGVDDVDFELISKIVSHDGCEVFIFFNYSAVTRISGLLEIGRDTPALRMIYGSPERVARLSDAVQHSTSTEQREAAIVDMYFGALRETAPYLLPFRVEYEEARKTSHYLIHATKHPLGFKIMKHVMWESGRDEMGGEGRLELRQASAGDISAYMRSDLLELDDEIVKHLSSVAVENVGTFRDDWVCRPDDFFSEGCYRRRLLKLEAEGKIEVLDEDRQTILPAEKRRRDTWNGGPSIASRLYVRLKR